jgi:transcriptional regulator with XRE-family HTH domain
MGDEAPTKKRRGRGNRKKITAADDQAEHGWKERRAEIMRLRIGEGLTQMQIAERLGMHQSQVAKELGRIREEWKPENVDELREIANARLDKVWRSLQPGLDEGDAQAANAATKVIAEHAKLNGLHAPVKTELTGTIDVKAAQDELLGRIARIAKPGDPDKSDPEPEPV